MDEKGRKWIITGGILGFLGVALGAFGAHGLRDSLPPEMMRVYETGVIYHLIHSVAVLAIGLTGIKKYYIAALMFTIGVVLFSFSLYFYAVTATVFYAMITPVGGLSFLAGWLLIVIQAVKKPKAE